MKLEPTESDRKAAAEWANRQLYPHPDDMGGRGAIADAWVDGYLAGVLAERERATKVAWDTKVPVGDFEESNRTSFAILNMTALQAAIAAAIRKGA